MRIFDIIKTELSNDRLKAEENLEMVMNSKDLNSNLKIIKIKDALKEIAIAELSFTTFEKYIGGEEVEKIEKD